MRLKINLAGDKRKQPITYVNVIKLIESLNLTPDVKKKLIDKSRSIPQGSLGYFAENIHYYVARALNEK